MMNLLFRCRISHQLSVSRGQMAMAEPDHTIAAHGAAPHGAIRGPALRIHEQALEEALGHPPVVSVL